MHKFCRMQITRYNFPICLLGFAEGCWMLARRPSLPAQPRRGRDVGVCVYKRAASSRVGSCISDDHSSQLSVRLYRADTYESNASSQFFFLIPISPFFPISFFNRVQSHFIEIFRKSAAESAESTTSEYNSWEQNAQKGGDESTARDRRNKSSRLEKTIAHYLRQSQEIFSTALNLLNRRH